ncbi:MAG TPA: BON domain-containing protein [Ktedonobacteraceae bacterium]|nr:BON domain-containing protein [Ktedonobacteraceae bacterium]
MLFCQVFILSHLLLIETKIYFLYKYPRALSSSEGIRISVEVEGSKVILRGTVRSYAEKKAVEETAWASPGVTDVENRIVVSPIL